MSNFIRHQVIDKKRNTLVGRDEFVSASAAAASCRNEAAGDDDGRGNLARITVAVVVASSGNYLRCYRRRAPSTQPSDADSS